MVSEKFRSRNPKTVIKIARDELCDCDFTARDGSEKGFKGVYLWECLPPELRLSNSWHVRCSSKNNSGKVAKVLKDYKTAIASTNSRQLIWNSQAPHLVCLGHDEEMNRLFTQNANESPQLLQYIEE